MNPSIIFCYPLDSLIFGFFQFWWPIIQIDHVIIMHENNKFCPNMIGFCCRVCAIWWMSFAFTTPRDIWKIVLSRIYRKSEEFPVLISSIQRCWQYMTWVRASIFVQPTNPNSVIIIIYCILWTYHFVRQVLISCHILIQYITFTLLIFLKFWHAR